MAGAVILYKFLHDLQIFVFLIMNIFPNKSMWVNSIVWVNLVQSTISASFATNEFVRGWFLYIQNIEIQVMKCFQFLDNKQNKFLEFLPVCLACNVLP